MNRALLEDGSGGGSAQRVGAWRMGKTNSFANYQGNRQIADIVNHRLRPKPSSLALVHSNCDIARRRRGTLRNHAFIRDYPSVAYAQLFNG